MSKASPSGRVLGAFAVAAAVFAGSVVGGTSAAAGGKCEGVSTLRGPENLIGEPSGKVESSGPGSDAVKCFVFKRGGSREIVSATLRLHATDDAEASGGDVRRTRNRWAEASVTWRSGPAARGTLLDSIGPVTSGDLVEADVTSAVRGPGSVSFRVASTSNDGVDYASREAGGGLEPELIVTTARGSSLRTKRFAAVADASLSASEPLTALGSSAVLGADANPREAFLLRFDLLGLGRVRPTADTSGNRICKNASKLSHRVRPALLRRAVICLANEKRRARGLEDLRGSRNLKRSAKKYTGRMVRSSCFSHACEGPDLAQRIADAGYLPCDCFWKIGENLAYGDRLQGSPIAIVTAWMESPPHRANLLDRGFDHLDIGVRHGTPRGGRRAAGATYTAHFGSRRPTAD